MAFGRLYAANTLGAIAGTALAGLVLIELFGLSGALAVGAACSAIAGVSALLLARGTDQDVAATPAAPTVPAATPAPIDEPWAHAASPSPAASPNASRVRLALVIAFLSGLTSLGYQVTWTRLLASGTGNTTYVFTVILTVFLIGIAIGAVIYNLIRRSFHDPVRILALTQLLVAALAMVGLVRVLGQPEMLDPNKPIETLQALFRSAVLVVLPVTIVLGIAFPTASALLRDQAEEAGSESGALLASNTTGAILGSLVIPFVLMPLIGSPMIVVVLALTNALIGTGLALIAHPRRLPIVAAGVLTVVLVGVVAAVPGAVQQPNEAYIASRHGQLFESTEDEIASVQAGQIRSTPELWVAGTSMTLLTVDAKLMPVLPVIARPNAQRALVVAFGMGTAFRAALIAGLQADVVELVPSVPKMFPWYYDDAEAVLADPKGKVIITDGRNHLELTNERFDVIVTDPPPPIESSGASVISSQEYYEAGKAHLTPDGIMMQWVPFGGPQDEIKDHVRTFTAVFPNVELIRGAGGYGFYMLGSMQPMSFDDAAIRAGLARPGVLEDISSAYDSPATTVDEWVDVIHEQQWMDDATASAFAGDGPLITDDRPRPEYFLLRRLGWLGSE
jgi:spermidine synthase